MHKMLFLLLPFLFAACSNTSMSAQNSQLKPCPSSPNCVSTDAENIKQGVSPFKIKGSVAVAWEELQRQVDLLPRSSIVDVSSGYIHVECRSALFGFVDDVEFFLRQEEGVIAIRSAARLGYSDFGVNRKRVENLRATLLSKGVIE